MKKLFLITLVLVLVFLLILGASCKPSAPGRQEILLGANAPLTGMYAAFGEGGVFGVRAAVEDINKLGGVYVKELGKKLPVKLVLADNLSDSIKAGTLAEDLILRDKVDFFVGSPDVPPSVAAVANIAEKYKTPYVGNVGPFEPINAMRVAAGGWKYTWGMGFAIAAPAAPGDFRNKPGYTVADTWLTVLKLFADKTNKRVAVFTSDDGDGRGWYAGFPPALKQAGYDVLGVDKELGMAPLGTTDFTPMINQWKNNNCEILWGNAPAPLFGTMWRQAQGLAFKPKTVFIGKAAVFYPDVKAWGGDLPWGLGSDQTWHPTLKEYKGIGDTTPQTLHERWAKATGQPFNMVVGLGYYSVQVLVDAIERAGTLDKDKVNKAIGETDTLTISHRVKFDENQFSRGPVAFSQWFKTDKPEKWEQRIVFSEHAFYPAMDKPIFPITYP